MGLNEICDKLGKSLVKGYIYTGLILIYLMILLYIMILLFSFFGLDNISTIDSKIVLSFLILGLTLTIICQNYKNSIFHKLSYNFLFSSLLLFLSLFSIIAYSHLIESISEQKLSFIIFLTLILGTIIFSHSFLKLSLYTFLKLQITEDIKNKINKSTLKIQFQNTMKKGEKQ